MGTTGAAPGPNAVHLCVDMQNLFAPGGPWATPWMAKVLPSVARLVAHAPERTVFTRFLPPVRASEAPGMWREYYRKWGHVTQERLQRESLDLVAELRRIRAPRERRRPLGLLCFRRWPAARLSDRTSRRHPDRFRRRDRRLHPFDSAFGHRHRLPRHFGRGRAVQFVRRKPRRDPRPLSATVRHPGRSPGA